MLLYYEYPMHASTIDMEITEDRCTVGWLFILVVQVGLILPLFFATFCWILTHPYNVICNNNGDVLPLLSEFIYP
jgi:hypothetical protein